MKTKIIQFIPVLTALVIIGFRYFSQWCIVTSSSCYGTWVHWVYLKVTNPLFYFAIFFLPIALVIVFVQREIFKSWLNLAVWAIPFLIIFIALTPDSNPGALMVFYPFYRDDAARLVGEVFSAISLLLICWKYFASRRFGQV